MLHETQPTAQDSYGDEDDCKLLLMHMSVHSFVLISSNITLGIKLIHSVFRCEMLKVKKKIFDYLNFRVHKPVNAEIKLK